MTNVIQIDDVRLTRLQRPSSTTKCKHMNLTMDSDGDVVICDDCKIQVSAFWALQMIAEHYSRAFGKLQRKYDEQAAVEKKTIHLKAAQKVEAVWRTRDMVPLCPHCAQPIFASDGLGGRQINKQIAERMAQTRIAAKRAADQAS